jgi:hypothetical protein
MLAMIKLGLKTRPALEDGTSAVEINAGLGNGASLPPQLPPPADAPTISLENDDK